MKKQLNLFMFYIIFGAIGGLVWASGILGFFDTRNTQHSTHWEPVTKEEYKKGVISNKSIEGLGFIDMIKKTGNPVQFSIKKVDEAFSFLVISSKVDRIKKTNYISPSNIS